MKKEIRYAPKYSMAYLLIKLKNGDEIFIPNFKNHSKFIRKVIEIYPSFDNQEGFEQEKEDKLSKFAAGILFICIAIPYAIYLNNAYILRNPILLIILLLVIMLVLIFLIKFMFIHVYLTKNKEK